MPKLFYYDLETTGLSPRKSAIHQLAAIIEIDGEVVETLDLKIKPFGGAHITEKALEVGGVTLDQINQYTPDQEVFKALKRLLGKYVDNFNPKDKFHLVGYNNRYFDDRFLRAWFERLDDWYFGSWFWADSIDVMVLASRALVQERHLMQNFKLGTVAKQFGVEVKSELLHESLYDVTLTREIYRVIL